jgi:hypothetical protein
MCPVCELPVSPSVLNCPECGKHKNTFFEIQGEEIEFTCKWCEAQNDPNERLCKRCGSPNWILTGEDVEQSEAKYRARIQNQAKNLSDCTEKELLIMLIREQRKTTYATRSLAITFVAAPVIALLVTVALVLAANSGNTAAMVVAGIFGAIASTWVLVKSLRELTLSNLD